MRIDICNIALIAIWLLTGSAWAQEESANDWVIRVSPYLWGLTLDGDSAIEPAPPLPLLELDLGFGDIISNVNFAASAHTEFTRKRWTFVIDPTYIDLEIDDVAPGLDMEIEVWFIEGWTAFEFVEHWEVLGGVRWQEQDIKVDTIEPLDEDWTDYFAGVRYVSPLGPKWYLTIRGDVVFAGDSDSSWNGEFTLSRRMGTGNRAFFFGYRYYTDDYESSAYFWDVNQHGPLIGYTWIF